MDKQSIVIDELDCDESDKKTTGFQVENFQYQVFSGTTSAIPATPGSGTSKREPWNPPSVFVQRLINRVKNGRLESNSGLLLKLNRCSRWHLCLISLAFLCQLILIILLAAQWSQLYHEKWLRAHQCSNAQCLAAAANLHRRINQSVKPCENFYRYACGLHLTVNHPSFEPDSPNALGAQAYNPQTDTSLVMHFNVEFGRALMRIHRPALDSLTSLNIHALISGLKDRYKKQGGKPTSAKTKVAKWFQSCSSRNMRDWFGNHEFYSKMIPALGGLWLLDREADNTTGVGSVNSTKDWPTKLFYSSILTKELSMKQNWSWFETMKLLHRDLHVPALFDFYLPVKSAQRPPMIEVNVDPNARAGRFYNTRFRTYMTKMMEIVINDAGIPHGDLEAINRTKIFVNDAVLVMFQLSSIFQEGRRKRNVVQLRELNAKGNQINWVEPIGDYFNQADNRIDDQTNIVTYYLDYLQSLGPLIDKIKANYSSPIFNRIMNNYFTWITIEAYAWHLSFEFASLSQQRNGQLDSSLEIDCFVLAHEFFSPILGAIFVENHLNPEVWNQTNRLVSYIKPSALKQLDSIGWLDSETKEKVKKRIEDLKIINEVPLIMRNDVKLDYAYRDLQISSIHINSLIDMIQYLRGVYNRIYAGIAEPHEEAWLQNNMNVYDNKIGINLVRDELYVPPGVVQPPFFHHTLPSAINFAGIGSMLASAVAQMIGESGSYSFHPQVTLLWSEKSWAKYLQHWDCIQDRLKNSTKTYFKVSDAVMAYVSESLRTGADDVVDEVTGLNIAKIGYNDWFANEERSVENTLLPGPHVPRDKLFYITYAQTFCESDDNTRDWWRIIFSENSLPLELIVNQIFSEEPDFATTFQCPVGSPMRPENQCSAIF
ncbi:Endothelin-converting enzyme 1 [Fasciola hepatica]|uniref:Endothelin-converting enzyme 1 n=1 Tax=Fasciola hepatica TaxID=6192 RepID=A0A4E0REY6_FASHE|nr:Endothelin-converting enzyme 1 [Fasciola hepatica]